MNAPSPPLPVRLRRAGSAVRFGLALGLVWLAAAPGPAAAFTVDAVEPFHLSPGDHFTVTLGGAGAFALGDVTVECLPVGGGAAVAATPLSVAGSDVGVRLPASIPVGEYEVTVEISGTPQEAPGPHLWVKERSLRLIKKTLANESFSYAPPGADFKEADLVDIDGDGALDVFSANSAGPSDVDFLFVNQANKPMPACAFPFCEEKAARITQQAGLAYNRTYDADFVDLDGDGDLDLVRTDSNGAAPLRAFVNDGAGNFDERTVDAGPIMGLLPPLADIAGTVGTSGEMDFGDLNGDGRPDILMCSWFGGTLGILLNDMPTTGKLTLLDLDCGGGSPHALCATQGPQNRGCALGDFDNDGRLDVIAPEYGAGSVGHPVVFLNTGNNGAGEPQFSTQSNWVKAADGTDLGMHGGDLKVADLDGDGDHDVAIASPGQGGTSHARILWNDGGTALRATADEPAPPVGDSYDVAFSDLDADGDLDIVFANEFEDSADNRVLINRGGVDGDLLFEEYESPDGIWWETQLFGPPVPTGDSSFELSVSLGDYDLDGDFDLVGAGFANKLDLWENGLFREDGERRDWVFALDRTRSMITPARDFFEPAKNVLIAYLAERYDTDVAGGDAVGLVTYDYAGSDRFNACAADTEAGVDVKAQEAFALGAAPAVDLITHVEGLGIGSCSGNCTSVGAALRRGIQTAEAGATPGREKVIVVITDGQNNQCPTPADILPMVASDTRVYAVALGAQTDDSALAELATNRGKFYVAGRSDDYASVQAALRDINADLEAHSTGKQVLSPVPLPILRRWAEKAARPEVFRLELPRPVPGIAVPPQRRVHRVAVDPADSEVRFTLSWRERNDAVRMVVTDPAGRVWPPPAGDPLERLVREHRGERDHVVEVLDPLSGIWTVEEIAFGETGPTKLTVLSASLLRLTAEPRFPIFLRGEALEIVARLAASGGPVPVTQVTASFLSPSEETIEVTAEREDEGVFRASLPQVAETGTWRVTLHALGTPQRPFERTWHAALHVEEPRPEAPDRRRLELELDRERLTAGSPEEATATARLSRQDGAPLTSAQVSFDVLRGVAQGSVTDHGDGRYSQSFTAGESIGAGSVHVRVGAFRFAEGADFEVLPGEVDAEGSTIHVKVGPLQLCAGHPGEYTVAVTPRDRFGNPVPGASVEIEQSEGPEVEWVGPVEPSESGRTYVRRFRASERAGRVVFSARVNGVELAETATLDLFAADSPEGEAMDCGQVVADSDGDGDRGKGCLWIALVVLVVLLLLLLLWLLLRRRRSR
jgi:hypothetical protein